MVRSVGQGSYFGTESSEFSWVFSTDFFSHILVTVCAWIVEKKSFSEWKRNTRSGERGGGGKGESKKVFTSSWNDSFVNEMRKPNKNSKPIAGGKWHRKGIMEKIWRRKSECCLNNSKDFKKWHTRKWSIITFLIFTKSTGVVVVSHRCSYCSVSDSGPNANGDQRTFKWLDGNAFYPQSFVPITRHTH